MKDKKQLEIELRAAEMMVERIERILEDVREEEIGTMRKISDETGIVVNENTFSDCIGKISTKQFYEVIKAKEVVTCIIRLLGDARRYENEMRSEKIAIAEQEFLDSLGDAMTKILTQ